MKYIISILFLIAISSVAQSEELKLIFPAEFDQKSLSDYELVWSIPGKDELPRVQLTENQISVDLNFSEKRPDEIMLYKNRKFLGYVKVLGKNILFSNITKITIDVTGVKNGGVFLKSYSGEGFYLNLMGIETETYDVMVDGKPIELVYVSNENYRIGMISVNSIEPCNLTISVDNDNKGNLDMKYSYSTKQLVK